MSDVLAADLPSRLRALVADARDRARELRRPVLVSVVERLAHLDPLGALGMAAPAASRDPGIARILEPGRMFWAHPSSGLAITALGAAVRIAPSGESRFAEADREWRELLETGLVAGDGDGAAMSGPVLVGGAAFEPDGPRTALWDGFPSTDFLVPALLVSAEQGRGWLTASVLVGADGVPSVALDALARLRDAVLSTRTDVHDGDEERDPADIGITDLRPRDRWSAMVADAVASIHEGEFRKVVLARGVRAHAPRGIDVLALLDYLRTAHRESYVFGCWRGTRAFVGASPERLVRLAGRSVDASSLAGSAPRGATAAEDSALAGRLLRSAKDRAEHAMVRSALVDALSRMCDDVQSDESPSLMTLPHVHHLHTAVHARLRDGHSLLELVGALHPTPAVGGTPRDRALAFIRDHEQLDRGWYAGPIGWVGRDAGELAVGLRSAIVSGVHATLFAGCGIVADSDPERELAESQVKLRPMQAALAATARGEDAVHAVGALSAEGD
jgi:isochorismate synthase